MQTEMLFMKDNYLKETKAKVVDVDSSEKAVVFDKTIFYPEGGGQPTDTGTIEFNGKTSKVTMVKKYPKAVVHYIEGKLPAEGQQVLLKLDWERRYGHMRHHTAQHLFSTLVLDRYGAATAGNQLHTDRARIDFKPLNASLDELKQLESRFNEISDSGIEVKCYFTDRETVLKEVDEARRNLFQRVPASVKEIRVVDIAGIDKCPCAGTHVANTKELGHIELQKAENKGKDVVRVSFILEE